MTVTPVTDWPAVAPPPGPEPCQPPGLPAVPDGLRPRPGAGPQHRAAGRAGARLHGHRRRPVRHRGGRAARRRPACGPGRALVHALSQMLLPVRGAATAQHAQAVADMAVRGRGPLTYDIPSHEEVETTGSRREDREYVNGYGVVGNATAEGRRAVKYRGFANGFTDKGSGRRTSAHGGSLGGVPQAEVNLWNVMVGALEIFKRGAGANKEELPISFKSGAKLAVSVPHSGKDVAGSGNQESEKAVACHVPSAPPLLTGVGDDVRAVRAVLEAEPPQWMPDSSAATCMQCDAAFGPLGCFRHHCRFCGGVFCRSCTGQRCLLPVQFREREPQRVCDTCLERLAPVQRLLLDRVSNAAQVALYDVTDASSLRSWLNNPLGSSLQEEIFKATSTLRSYATVGSLRPERLLPDTVLRGALGLAIVTVAKVGAVMTYKLGTGLVVARRPDGSWSAPSALVTCGIGWGAQIGGELTDYIVVLRSYEAVKAFCGMVLLSVGAGLSAAAGLVGRAVEIDLRAGDGGAAMCYTYSCSKGAFIGISVESSIAVTRSEANCRFYGDRSITSSQLLLGSVPRPRAAAPLYAALDDLFAKVEAPPCLEGTA
eukprot:SM000048S16539  [mRNA]  locus=s48:228608:232041:- [translate_table: standard]